MRLSFPSAQTNRPHEPRRRQAAHPRRRQHLGLTIGAVVGLACVVLLQWPGWEHLHTKGPMNTGHAMLACQDCHQPVPGTLW